MSVLFGHFFVLVSPLFDFVAAPAYCNQIKYLTVDGEPVILPESELLQNAFDYDLLPTTTV
jgi:hypothetical protein